MTPELFSDAMNEIGAKYVEEALTYKRPAQRSFWSKLAKRAATVALVPLLALSGFAAASPAARAAMIHWVETWTGSQVSYEYAGDAPTGELPFYTITALPDGYTLDDVLVHDATTANNTLHFMLAMMGCTGQDDGMPVALGVIRSVDAPTYDHDVEHQLEEVSAKKKDHCLTELLMQGETWEVK
mgnify:CR=1 FL=1